MQSYPKRLIEVELPIKRIAAHSRREKSIRHGHISTLHIWWARRPLAACRAVICAALWPDPVDALCPESFRQAARQWMSRWANDYLGKMSPESYQRFIALQKDPERLNDNDELRGALLDFIADFANWDNSTVSEYLDTSRALTQAAHEALGGEPGTRPLVVDPFAGGGSIPLEALRVGADAFASDLNPIPVLLNKVILEYIPKYGQRLADEVRKWGPSPLERVFFSQRSNQVPDRAVLGLVVLSPEQSWNEEKKTKALVDMIVRESGMSGRTFKSALLFVVPQSPAHITEDARRLLAWEEIQTELPGISIDDAQRSQLAENLRKAQRDLRETVWRTYKNIMLLGKDNQLHTIDLGLVHSSAAESLVQFIVHHLRQMDEIQSGISDSSCRGTNDAREPADRNTGHVKPPGSRCAVTGMGWRNPIAEVDAFLYSSAFEVRDG